MLPFTEPEFFAVFGRYNLAIWPVQIVAYALAAVALCALLLRTAWAVPFTLARTSRGARWPTVRRLYGRA